MRKVTSILALIALGLTVSANAQVECRGGGCNYFTPGSGGSATLEADYGPNLAPALTAANWTCGAGWDCSVSGTLNKNADGVGTAAPTSAITAVVGATYKVVITVGEVSVGNGFTYTFGGTSGETALTAATTYTHNVTAVTTASLIITPTPTATRATITAVSVTRLTDSTGDLTVDGNLTVRSPSYFKGPILASDGTAAAPAYSFAGSTGTGFFRVSASVFLAASGTNYLRFNNDIGLVSDAGKLTFGAASDVALYRDAANTLALRNGTAAQTFNISASHTDASNYSRLSIKATAGIHKVVPEASGSGTLYPFGIGDGGTKPACDANSRGGIWYDAGGAGVADTYEVCRKDAADSYAWVSVF